MRELADETFALTTFYSSWKEYQDHLKETLASLSDEQLTLRTAPGLRSIGENALHIVGCRMHWYADFLGEDGGAALLPYARWNAVALGAPYASSDAFAQALGAPAPTAGELAQGLDRTWHFIADRLERWSAADLRATTPDVGEDGTSIDVPRAWVVWHVLEHDLHHGGEISLTLGTYGIPAAFAV